VSSIWRTLGIASTRDRTAIRRAYAARLKVVHPEDDAAGFQALRAAYEQALRLAAQAERAPQVSPGADWDDGDDAEPVVDETLPAQPMEVVGPPAGRPRLERDIAASAPPPPPPQIDRVGREEVQALGATMQALRQAVAADDRDQARALLKAVLASPAMDAVSVRGQVEGELGALILQGGMGAAVLIDPASAEFGWTSERLGGNAALAQAVRARRADLAFLVNIRSPQSAHNTAFRALTERPAGAALWRYRLTPGLPKAVRLLLDLIYGQHNSLARELDGEAVAWWSAYLSRPQLGPAAFWTAVFAPPLIASLISQEWSLFGLSGSASFGVAYGLALVGVVAGLLAGVLGLGRAQAWWREARAHAASSWERYGWAGLAAAALALAAVLPAGWGWALVPLPFTLATVAWAAITAERDNTGPIDVVWSLPFSWILPFLRVQTRTPPWVLLGLGLIPLLIVWPFALQADGGAVARMAGPFYGAAIAFVAGHHSLENAWRYRIAPRVRSGILIAAALATASLPGLIWSAAPSMAYAPLLATAVAMLVFGERIVTLGWDRRLLRDKLFHWGGVPALFLAVFVDEDLRQGGAYLLAGALWLLAGVTAGLVGALRRERELARLAPA
jgi:hypothetical protein